jgi:probable HAF family extracellular repeat protein
MATLRVVLAVAVLGAFLCSPAVAAVAYTVTDLGVGAASGINNSGQVVGENGAYDACIWSNGTMTDLGVSGEAYGINDSGQVVGQYYTAAGNWTAFIYSNGVINSLGIYTANAINNAGQVVGENGAGAFLYSNGVMTNLGAGAATCINNAGQVVGYNNPGAFLYSNGVMSELGTLGGWSMALGINDASQVVGCYSTNGGGVLHAFLYSNGTMTSLGGGVAYGINNAGQVVGQNGVNHAFLYSNGVMTDLNSLIDPASGWTLEDANAINDNGQIVGYGIGPDGNADAYLLTPTPEPATVGLLAAGLAALIARRNKRR